MLIEQIIEFESKAPKLPGLTCTPMTGYFDDKTKISEKNFEWIIIYCHNSAGGYVPCFFLPGRNHLQNLTPIFKVLDEFWN